REQRAVVPYRQIDGAAGGQLLAVEIAAELARLLAVLPAERLGRRDRQLAEERPQRHGQPRRQDCAAALAVEGAVDDAVIRKVLRQRAAVGAEQIVAPVLAQFDV